MSLNEMFACSHGEKNYMNRILYRMHGFCAEQAIPSTIAAQSQQLELEVCGILAKPCASEDGERQR
jgi:hypothetical protein